MTSKKLRQVAKTREAVAHLRNTPHAKACRCCTRSLDKIDTDADANCAVIWLAHVGTLCADIAPPTYERSEE